MKAADLVGHVQRFWAKVDRHSDPDGCWPWMGQTNNHGYGRFECQEEGRRTRVLSHRFAAVLSGMKLSPGQNVLHGCDNPPCCNPAHLRIGTQRDNIRDAIERGRLNTSGLEIGQKMPTIYRGQPAACGTESGAKRHRRHGEAVCDPCRDAVRAARRRREGRAA